MKEEKVDKLAPIVEVHTPKPNIICKKHEFKYMSGLGLEVKCMNCPLGYQLSPGAVLRDGHIYIKDQLLI